MIYEICEGLYQQVLKNMSFADQPEELKYNETILKLAMAVKETNRIDLTEAIALPPDDCAKACFVMMLNRVVDNWDNWEKMIHENTEYIAKQKSVRIIATSEEAKIKNAHLVNDFYGIGPVEGLYNQYSFERNGQDL